MGRDRLQQRRTAGRHVVAIADLAIHIEAVAAIGGEGAIEINGVNLLGRTAPAGGHLAVGDCLAVSSDGGAG